MGNPIIPSTIIRSKIIVKSNYCGRKIQVKNKLIVQIIRSINRFNHHMVQSKIQIIRSINPIIHH